MYLHDVHMYIHVYVLWMDGRMHVCMDVCDYNRQGKVENYETLTSLN